MTEITSASEKKFISLLGKNYPVIECNVTHNLDKPTTETSSHSSSSILLVNQSENSLQSETSSMTDTHNSAEVNESTTDVSESIDSNTAMTESPKPSSDPGVQTTESRNDIVHDILPTTDEPEGGNIDDVMDVVNMAAAIEESPANSGEDFQYQANTEVSEEEDIYKAAEENMEHHDENAATASQSQMEPTTDPVDPPMVDAQLDTATPEELSEEPHQYPESVSEHASGQIVSISGKMDILDYANAEWKGTTYKAQCLRKGYKMLIKATGCTFLRQARGDNYCALRATAFQVLTQNLVLFRNFPNWEEHLTGLAQRLKSRFEWVTQWSFADRLQSNALNRIAVMEDCLAYFVQQLKISQAFTNDIDRQLHFSALFNSGSTVEIKLFEALKLLLLDTAVQLHDANMKGDEVPVFAWLLFARDTSTDPKSLMLNHLNPAGKSGGLEQVEMCLLGQALQLTIRVVRPSNVEQEDFVTYYPDHKVEEWDRISLIAEDDRHYNIVVP